MDTFKQSKVVEKSRITKKQASDSGMAFVLILLICFALFRSDLLLLLAIISLVFNMIFSMIFKPFAFVWFGLSRILGTFMSKIMLALVFFVVVFPMGFLRRLLGKDSLQLRRFGREKSSVFTERNHEYCASDIDKPY